MMVMCMGTNLHKETKYSGANNGRFEPTSDEYMRNSHSAGNGQSLCSPAAEHLKLMWRITLVSIGRSFLR